MESEQRKKGVILSYVSIIASTLVQLLYTPLLIRKLGQSEYGIYSLVSSIIGYLTVLDLGFGNAIIVYTAKYKAQGKYNEEKKLHGMFFVIFCIIGVIVTILGLILFLNVNNMFGKTMTEIELYKIRIMMLILTFNLAITFPFTIYSSIITAYERFSFQKVMSILNTILKPLIMIPLLFMGLKSIGMCVVITIVNIFVLFSNYLYCRKKLNIKIKYSGFDKNLFKTIFSYSFFIFLSVIVDRINWSVDNFVLATVSGSIAVSIYNVASQLNTLYINLAATLNGIMLPKVSKMIATNASDKELNNEFIKVGRLQCYIIFLLISGFVILGKEFIKVWAGGNFSDSYYITVILIVPAFFSLIQNLGISIMQAKNMHRFRSILLFFIALGNIVISIPLAKMYGGIGSAIGTSISIIVGNVIILNFYYYFKVHINVVEFWKNIAKMVIGFCIPLFITVFLQHIFKLTGYMHIIIFGIIYVSLYSIISYFLVMNEYEKKLVDSIINKVIRKKEKH